MKYSPTLAGIFFTNYEMMWALATYDDASGRWPATDMTFEPDGLLTSSSKTALRMECKGNPRDDIAAVLDQIAKCIKLEELEALTFATIGPFEGGFVKPFSLASEMLGKSYVPTRISRHSELLGWRQFPIETEIRNQLRARISGVLPEVFVLRDSEALLLGEHYRYRKFTGKDRIGPISDTVLYLYLDNVVSSACLARNTLFSGDTTPELGHMPIFRHRLDKQLESCSAHALPCLQANISFPAIEERWDLTLWDVLELDRNSEKLEIIAFYIAQVLAQAALSLAPTTMIIGGRIASNRHLLPYVRAMYADLLSGDKENDALFPNYVMQTKLSEHIKSWTSIEEGVLGCLSWSLMKGSKMSQLGVVK